MPVQKIDLEISNRTLSIEFGKMGKQADGSAFIRYGDTIMFVTATSKKEMKGPKPFFPLTVDYRENTSAAGKIPGGFFKREGRPSEREVLISRMIDRPVRTLFPDGYFNDTQIVALLLSADTDNESDTLALIGASVALYFSDIPFSTPFGAVKVGYVNDEYVINPTRSQLEDSPLDMIVVGTEDGIVMMEAECAEVEEDKIIQATSLAQTKINEIINVQKDLFSRLDIKKREFKAREIDQDMYDRIEKDISNPLLEAIQFPGKKREKDEKTNEILNSLLEKIPEENIEEVNDTKDIYYSLQKKLVRNLIIEGQKRVDGRTFDEIRPISIEVGLLPRTHGSALFTRGETQCLATVTLGTSEDIQRVDGLIDQADKRFMLHYNFPPFSVGEVSFLRGPGRREIGHGALAEKAILPTMPNEEDFPYTTRIVCDILESNGSSSMASICGGVLALMDAGVPLKSIIAGMAIGLVKEDDRYAILTDIAGLEDHVGDMDLKVAGTEKGITAIQMDLKIPHLSIDMLKEAIEKARLARLKVIEKMREILPEPRTDISRHAPRMISIFINPEKVGDVIGPAGKIIKKIIAETKTKINIDETGKITIASVDSAAAEKAREMIRDITVEAEVGKDYTGKIIRIEDYGAFVEILPNIVGLLHISEIAHQHTRNIRDVMRLGDVIRVKVITIDENNKVRVSKKALEERPSYNEDFDDRSRDSNPHSYRDRDDKKRD